MSQIVKNETCGARGAYSGGEECTQGFSGEIRGERISLEYIRVNGKIILKYAF